MQSQNRPQGGNSASVDNKYGATNQGIFDDLNYIRNTAPSQDLIEMDQRQRIFEEVIISRIKVVQDFVKQKVGKLNKEMRDCRTNQLIASSTEKFTMDDMKGPSANLMASQGTKGSIIEVVEEALKWRLEANNKKQSEIMENLVDKVNENKRLVDMLSSDNSAEILEVKNQIVEAVSDVLL